MSNLIFNKFRLMGLAPKNKIILLGNGFDLSHNLQTRFEDFVTSLFKNWVKKGPTKGKEGIFYSNLEDDYHKAINHILTISELDWNDTIDKIEATIRGKINNLMNANRGQYNQDYCSNVYASIHNGNTYLLGNKFFWDVVRKSNKLEWINFEREYYRSLKNLTVPFKGNEDVLHIGSIRTLNSDFQKIKDEFIDYLKNLDINPEIKINGHSEYFSSARIYSRDKEHLRIDRRQASDQLILNFNYTDLPSKLYSDAFRTNRTKTTIINIHGDLKRSLTDNPIIFGYGDEMDEEYHYLESLEEDEVLRHFKSTQYSKTHNYHRMLNFMEIGPYQVDIIGHGCGMTDRVLLNTLFEHDNCDRIKLFHYKNIQNYTESYMHISRHFNKDKKDLLRKRVLPYDPKTPCPQWDDEK